MSYESTIPTPHDVPVIRGVITVFGKVDQSEAPRIQIVSRLRGLLGSIYHYCGGTLPSSAPTGLFDVLRRDIGRLVPAVYLHPQRQLFAGAGLDVVSFGHDAKAIPGEHTFVSLDHRTITR